MSHPSYYKNLCGIQQDDEIIQRIPAPRIELTTHVTIKTTQAFGLLGMGAAPVVSFIKGQRDFGSIQQRALHYGKNGITAGLVAGPLITLPFLLFRSYNRTYDDCYRIRLNKSQLTADRFSFVGLALGLGAAQYFGKALGDGALYGYVGGFALGTLCHIVHAVMW